MILSTMILSSLAFNNFSALETKNIYDEQESQMVTENNDPSTCFEIYNGDDLKNAISYSKDHSEHLVLKLKNNINTNYNRYPLFIPKGKTITILSDNENKRSISSDYYIEMGENSVLNLKSIECYDIIMDINPDTELNILDNSSVTNIRENYGTINISDDAFVNKLIHNCGKIINRDNQPINTYICLEEVVSIKLI